jgi:hypothetical protein
MKPSRLSIGRWEHWTRLADSYEFNVTLERFLHDMHEAGRPFHVETIPKPPSYDDGPTEPRERVMAPFREHSDSFNPETLALLEGVLNETWAALQSNQKTFELETRTAIADLVVKFAQQGERDPQRLKALVLAALPSYAPPIA